MTVGLPPHSHCWNCDAPIPEGERFCSPECEKELMTKRKKSSRKMLIFYLGAAVVFMIIGFLVSA